MGLVEPLSPQPETNRPKPKLATAAKAVKQNVFLLSICKKIEPFIRKIARTASQRTLLVFFHQQKRNVLFSAFFTFL